MLWTNRSVPVRRSKARRSVFNIQGQTYMLHSALLGRGRVPPESVGRDIARLLAPTYATLLEDQVPDTFAAILVRMDASGMEDVALRLIDLAHSETDDQLTWASYEHQPDASRFIDPRWRMTPKAAVQH
jgi:hypothetical protein